MTGGPRKQDGILQQSMHYLHAKADEFDELSTTC
jgi:hypothetical protein